MKLFIYNILTQQKAFYQPDDTFMYTYTNHMICLRPAVAVKELFTAKASCEFVPKLKKMKCTHPWLVILCCG